VTATLAPTTALTALDRCDRCGAQAYVRVTLSGGGELLFCGHHFAEFRPALEAKSAIVHDETDRLIDTPAAPVSDDA
jgi:hypothetical protein